MSDLSHVTRKPVFGVCKQVRLKLACSADETSYGLDISAIRSRRMILFRQRTTKALIRLRGNPSLEYHILCDVFASKRSPFQN